MEKISIVAVSDNWAIGKNNQLLWHISEDLKYFKQVTLNYPVIMGYRTFYSIGRALPKRRNIVISKRQWDNPPQGIEIVSSLQEAFDLCEGEDKIFVIGGAATYAEAMPLIDKIYLTSVYKVVEDADAFFPVIEEDKWSLSWQSPIYHSDKEKLDFQYKILSKI